MKFDFDPSLCSFAVPDFVTRNDFEVWIRGLGSADRSQIRHLQIMQRMFGEGLVRGKDRKYFIPMSMDEFVTYKDAIDAIDDAAEHD